MNQDKNNFDNDERTNFEILKSLLTVVTFPFSVPFVKLGEKYKEQKEKQKSDALSTCGCLLVFVAIILLVAVCAA